MILIIVGSIGLLLFLLILWAKARDERAAVRTDPPPVHAAPPAPIRPIRLSDLRRSANGKVVSVGHTTEDVAAHKIRNAEAKKARNKRRKARA